MELHIKVAQAVHVLNHDSQSCNRVAANQWLVQFQQSDAAWEIATSILTSHHHHPFLSDYEVEFFAAQILKRKIQNECHNLQGGAKDALLNALLVAAKRFTPGPPQLLTQICLALSTLILHAAEDGKPIEKLFYSLQNLQSQDNGNAAVLEMLTVLPEIIEDQNGDFSVSSARRKEYGQELLAQTPTVLEFLMQQIGEGVGSHDRSRKILRCLLSWVRAGCFCEIPPGFLPAHPLFNFVFSSLQVASSFELAVEVLVELVSRHEGLPQVLLCRIGFLKEALLFPALKSGDKKVIGGLASLMSEIGQAAPFLIVEANTEALELGHALLSCAAFPSEDWEIVDSTLQFWCSLSGHIIALEVENAEYKKKLQERFSPIFSALVDALLFRVQVNDTFDENGRTIELPSGLEQFRMNLVELLVDICQLLGPALFIQKIFLRDWIPTSMHISWREVEAKLFVLNAVSEVVLKEEHPFDISVIMDLVMILSSKSSEDLRGFMCLVYKALADVIGSYAKWIPTSQTNTRPLILFFAAGITQPFCSSACAFGFRKFCEEAAAVMHEPSNLEILIWIGEGLEDRKLPLEEENEVVGAISLILCTVSDKMLMHNMFARLLSPSYATVGKLINEDHGHALRHNPSIYTHLVTTAGRGLNRIGTVFSYLASHLSVDLGPDESIFVLLEAFWPMLEKLLISDHIESGSLSTAVCRALTLAIQASGHNFGPLLPQVLDSISANFLKFSSHECYMRTASVIVEEFGCKEEYGSLFMSTFERFTCSPSVMALTSSYICDQEPDLVEAYTNFASVYVRSCPKEILAASGSLFEVSLPKAGISCTALHRGAALSAMSYMNCFLEMSIGVLVEADASIPGRSVQDMVMRVISICGEGLISNLVYALLGVSAMSRVHKCATILQQLGAMCSLSERREWKGVVCWEMLQRWLYSALHTLPGEYLKAGEVECLVPNWMKGVAAAASDRLDMEMNSHMRGKGGRHLKRLLRDFANNHRNLTS
ncbi:transportin MOS14-like isoform X1 [Salvia splendens]|uniref:transportin MOS14-like isoform X1 n=2 Tax=Salvia splendens TaxID=180675 RepID=UPI001C252823|nr:transportin MOS14-like isoform X1 [Salvia splendens]